MVHIIQLICTNEPHQGRNENPFEQDVELFSNQDVFEILREARCKVNSKILNVLTNEARTYGIKLNTNRAREIRHLQTKIYYIINCRTHMAEYCSYD